MCGMIIDMTPELALLSIRATHPQESLNNDLLSFVLMAASIEVAKCRKHEEGLNIQIIW